MTKLKSGNRETILSWALRNNYSPEKVNVAWRDGKLAALHHNADGKLVMEPQRGLKMHQLRSDARPTQATGSTGGGPTVSEAERPSLTARLDPKGHAHRQRVEQARQDHDRHRSGSPRTQATPGAEPVSLGERIRSKGTTGRH